MKTKLITTVLLTIMTTVVSSEQAKQELPHGVASFELNKYTISAGGGVISGGIYSVTGSIAQLDAGHHATGSIYQVNGGFLTGNSDIIFKNGFE
jgi:hypothetical protein